MTTEELKSIIAQATETGDNPAALVTLFDNLGSDVVIEGAILRDALQGTPLEPADEGIRQVLDNIAVISKKDNIITVQNKEKLKSKIYGQKVELSRGVRFRAGVENLAPTLSRIRGVRADTGKIGLVELSRLQFTNKNGEPAIKVAVNKGILPLPEVEIPLRVIQEALKNLDR